MDLESIKIGFALGSGAARGWAHIGVIRALAEIGIQTDIVVAVNLNKISVGQPLNHVQRKVAVQHTPDAMLTNETHNLPYRLAQDLKDRDREALSQLWRGGRNKPGLFYVLNNSAYFMRERIARSRLACDPPDITLAPGIEEIGFMDFHRAAEAIEIGQHCVQQHEREITLLMSNYNYENGL